MGFAWTSVIIKTLFFFFFPDTEKKGHFLRRYSWVENSKGQTLLQRPIASFKISLILFHFFIHYFCSLSFTFSSNILNKKEFTENCWKQNFTASPSNGTFLNDALEKIFILGKKVEKWSCCSHATLQTIMELEWKLLPHMIIFQTVTCCILCNTLCLVSSSNAFKI